MNHRHKRDRANPSNSSRGTSHDDSPKDGTTPTRKKQRISTRSRTAAEVAARSKDDLLLRAPELPDLKDEETPKPLKTCKTFPDKPCSSRSLANVKKVFSASSLGENSDVALDDALVRTESLVGGSSSSFDHSFNHNVLDLHCPICLNIFSNPFIIRCGHTFCYDCLQSAFQEKNQCPLCEFKVKDHSIDTEPHNALNIFLKGESGLIAPLEVTSAFKQGGVTLGNLLQSRQLCDLLVHNQTSLDLSEVRGLINILNRRESYLLAKKAVSRKILCLEFLTQLRKEKFDQLHETQEHLKGIESDISMVNSWLREDSAQSVLQKQPYVPVSTEDTDDAQMSDSFNDPTDVLSGSERADQMVADNYDASIESDRPLEQAIDQSESGSQTDIVEEVKKFMDNRLQKVKLNFDDLKSVYFEHHSRAPPACAIKTFSKNLASFAEFTSIECRASFSFPDNGSVSTIVSSVEFDKDYQYFAVAGVCKKIKLYDFNGIPVLDSRLYYPVVEMNCTSKISSITWNDFQKNLLASADYDGGIQVWDAYQGTKIRNYQEHAKRVWSVDYNHCDPKMLASGSDDMKVRLWAADVERSVCTLESKANVCCVQFSPSNRNHLAFGSADHSVTMVDIRHTLKPLFMCKNHRKAVAYVKFPENNEFVSASTDSHIRLWKFNHLKPCDPFCSRTYTGHLNEKNFVGLDCYGEYIASGSENNTLFIYHKEVSRPVLQYKFVPPPDHPTRTLGKSDGSEFLSAVAWKRVS